MVQVAEQERHNQRKAYFEASGIVCPQDSQGRLDLALRYLTEKNYRPDIAYFLFDWEIDKKVPEWRLLACILSSLSPRSKPFNPAWALKSFDEWFKSSGSDELNAAQLAFLEKLSFTQIGYVIGIALDGHAQESLVAEDLKPLRERTAYIKAFLRSVIEIQIIRKSILDKYKASSVDDFFEKIQGYNHSLDYSDHEIRMRIRAANSGMDDAEAWFMAVNPWVDCADEDVSYHAGWLLRNPNTSFYNADSAYGLLQFHALKYAQYNNMSMMSSFWLGHHFNGGASGRIDHNAAVFWFEVSKKLGHGMAPVFTHRILSAHDERAYDKNDTDFQKRLSDLLVVAESIGQHCAMDAINTAYAHGAGKWNDQNRVYNHYEQIIEDDSWAPPQLQSLQAYTLRALLFSDVERQPEDLLARLKISGQEQQTFYNAEQIKDVEHIERILKHLKDPFYSQAFRATAGYVESLYSQKLEESDFQLFAGNDPSAGSTEKMAFKDALWASDKLAGIEDWYVHPAVYKKFSQVNKDFLRLTDSDLKRSAMLYGPVYNPVAIENSLPVLGYWLKPNDPKTAKEQEARHGIYTPAAGVIKINGLKADFNGAVKFDCVSSETRPAMLLPEDFEVVLALAFGDAEGPLWPTLSLERKHKDLLDDEHEMFQAKIWSPEWLGHTDFGKTFYIIDELAGVLTWRPKEFDIAAPKEAFDEKFPDFVRDFINDLGFTGGVDKATQSQRIFVSPEHIPLRLTKKNQAGVETWSVDILGAKMRINGAYTQEIKGVEDRSIGLNDTRFGQGRLTQRLTDHYNDIALMMPVFERYRQLMALLYAVIELRKNGYRFNTQTQKGIADNLKRYESMPPIPRKNLITKDFPFRLQ